MPRQPLATRGRDIEARLAELRSSAERRQAQLGAQLRHGNPGPSERTPAPAEGNGGGRADEDEASAETGRGGGQPQETLYDHEGRPMSTPAGRSMTATTRTTPSPGSELTAPPSVDGRVKSPKFEIALGAAELGLFARIWTWFTPRKKLSHEEIDRYLADIERQIPAPPDEMREFLGRLRAWAEADDGQPVFMLNLMRYYERVQTFAGSPKFEGSPQECNAVYEKRVQPLLLKVGGYPLVAGPAQGNTFMSNEPQLDNWSRILLVRYPSREAFLRLISDPAYAPIEPYKTMALKVALVPVAGERVIPELRAVAGGALLCLFLAAGWIRAAQHKPIDDARKARR